MLADQDDGDSEGDDENNEGQDDYNTYEEYYDHFVFEVPEPKNTSISDIRLEGHPPSSDIGKLQRSRATGGLSDKVHDGNGNIAPVAWRAYKRLAAWFPHNPASSSPGHRSSFPLASEF